MPRFEISSEIVGPPLTFQETAKKYGVSEAEVKRVRKFLGEMPVAKPESRRSRKTASKGGATRRTTKPRRSGAASKASR